MSIVSPFETEKLGILVERAVEFHGHLGPFLVLGLRMGVTGLRELKVERGDRRLRVTAKLKDSIPFSCSVDGLQVATKCTIGNKKLTIVDYEGAAAKFEVEGGKQATVSVKSTFFDMLKKRLLSKSVRDEKVRELARLVAATPEEELFRISRG
jgi:formylmethanofuran dehydrogenase subunit E